MLFFFFKQKTAYEMRISDWSSDVCSSDLILVRRNDGDVPPFAHRGLGIAGDQIVGLETFGLDTGKRKGAGGVADQRELRAQILGRFGAVRLILVVDVVAERLAAVVEDDGQMRSEENTSELQSLMRISYAVF